MEVVFTQDVPNQARAGEVRRVADGYARNYLIPQGMAQVATPEVLKRLHKIKAIGDETRVRETGAMQSLADVLDGTSISVSARITPTGRYYGAITSSQIASQLSAVVGREIDRRLLEAGGPIREPGEYEVVLRWPGDIQATIQIVAEIEE
jgi:large subunit ribosomal protein L9